MTTMSDLIPIYKSIQYPGYEHYEVSNFGHVRNSRTGKSIEPQIDPQGYYRVGIRNPDLGRMDIRIHRLVAEHFVYRPRDAFRVTFVDFNRDNYAASNLLWSGERRDAHEDEDARWVVIPNFGKRYEISEYGDIRNEKGQILQTYRDYDDRQYVFLYRTKTKKNRRMIHRLVKIYHGKARYGGRSKKIFFRDGDVQNNHISNLRWSDEE